MDIPKLWPSSMKNGADPIQSDLLSMLSSICAICWESMILGNRELSLGCIGITKICIILLFSEALQMLMAY
jgi:hypothetical protein